MAIAYKDLVEKTEGKRQIGRYGIDGKIIQCIFKDVGLK